jgi:hypothetical protein
MQVVAPVVEHLFEAGTEVTVYLVIGLPLSTEALHETLASMFPAVSVTCIGAVGAPTVTDEAADGPLTPLAFRAFTVIEYF